MHIRRALAKDSDRINVLLLQVAAVHHDGRPDLFKNGTKKYTDEELLAIIEDDDRPILVACDDENNVLGYAFCIFQQHLHDNILTDIKTLYIDDLCVDEAAVAYAKDHDCYNVTLNVWACNTSAMKFYERCGLKPQKVGMELILDSKE